MILNWFFLGAKGEPGITLIGEKGSEGLPGEKGEKGNYTYHQYVFNIIFLLLNHLNSPIHKK